MLKARTSTSPGNSPPSPSGAEMQSVHSVVTLSFEAAVTQEPAADTQGNIGQVAATQETTTTPPGDTQEPPVGGINVQINAEAQPLPPLEPTTPQARPTISALQEEIEFLKSQIHDYQEEIIRVKEACQNERNLHILAWVACAAEKSKENEYMCANCGEIYTQAGYKVVAESMTGVIPEPSVVVVEMKELVVTQIAEAKTEPPQPSAETEQPVVTQEPACSPKMVQEQTEKPAATQEQVGSPKTVQEQT